MTKGFTLVELLIAVAIMGILGSAAILKAADALRKTREATTRGNLGTIRSALAIYYSDSEGQFPMDNLDSLVAGGKFLKAMPLKSTPYYHPDGNDVSNGPISAMTFARGDWFYVSDPLDSRFGSVYVDCDHKDLKGNVWSSY